LIRVRVFRAASGLWSGFEVAGHAQTAPKGEDLVCSGVSAIVEAIAFGLERHLDVPTDVRQASGELVFRFPVELTSEKELHASQVLLETLFLSLQALSETYPGIIEVKEAPEG